GQRPGSNEREAVHLPDSRRAVGVLPDDVGFAVAVEVARPDRTPGRAGIADSARGEEREAVHLPDTRESVGILPKNVRLAVAVEVAGADRVPSGAGVAERARGKER